MKEKRYYSFEGCCSDGDRKLLWSLEVEKLGGIWKSGFVVKMLRGIEMAQYEFIVQCVSIALIRVFAFYSIYFFDFLAKT
jgi:hypothetical protein